MDRELTQLGQSTQRQAVRLARARQLLRIRDDQLLGRRGRDREDPRREFVAGLGLQQRRILAAVQEVLVGDARGLLLDDLALLPAIAHAHREAADGRARRQRDAEAPLARAVLRVAEDQVQLGERQRIVDDRLRRQRHQLQARAVGAGQAQRRGRLGREHAGRAGFGREHLRRARRVRPGDAQRNAERPQQDRLPRGAEASIGEPNARRMCERVWMGSCPLYTHELANGSKPTGRSADKSAGGAARRAGGGRAREPSPDPNASATARLTARACPGACADAAGAQAGRITVARAAGLGARSHQPSSDRHAPAGRVSPRAAGRLAAHRRAAPPAPPARGPRSHARRAGRPVVPAARARAAPPARARRSPPARNRRAVRRSARCAAHAARSSSSSASSANAGTSSLNDWQSMVCSPLRLTVSNLASFAIASFTRILTVPSGLPVLAAISLWLKPLEVSERDRLPLLGRQLVQRRRHAQLVAPALDLLAREDLRRRDQRSAPTPPRPRATSSPSSAADRSRGCARS